MKNSKIGLNIFQAYLLVSVHKVFISFGFFSSLHSASHIKYNFKLFNNEKEGNTEYTMLLLLYCGKLNQEFLFCVEVVKNE